MQNQCCNIYVKLLLSRKPQRTEYDLAYMLRGTNLLKDMSPGYVRQFQESTQIGYFVKEKTWQLEHKRQLAANFNEKHSFIRVVDGG